MSAAMTTDQRAARTTRAVAAAVAAGRERGLAVAEPIVLHDVFSVVVHLAPSPVVVRVPTVLAPGMDLDDLADRQRTELAVVSWLAEHRAPVIAPSPLVNVEPVRHDGFSMTFWQYVDRDSSAEPDYVRNAALVADLHLALRDYPGELSFLSAAEPKTLTASFAVLAERPDLIAPAELERAQHEWELIEPLVSSRTVFDAAFPDVGVQPIHGDAPAYNIVPTANGALYADFELTSLGPVEWDLAAFGPEAADAYDAAAAGLGLRPLDRRVLRFVEAVGMARTIACLALVDELPLLREGIEPAIEQWRSQPFPDDLLS